MVIRLVFALLASLLAFDACAQPAKPPPRQQYADALRLVDVWLDAQRDYEHLAGLSAGVVIGEELVWSKGYGTIDAARKVRASADTIYSVCSISKLFTSIAIMQLVEAGKLRLDDDIATVLPAFDMARGDPDSGPITIRGLLTHSSGLPNEAEFTSWTGPDHRFGSTEEVQGNLKKLRTMMPAYDHYQYSNLGMSLLGQVVERVSGMPYPDYVQSRILAPLKLSETRTYMPMNLYGTQLAQGFGPIKRDATRDPVKPFDARGYAAAAGYTSTVGDIAKFAAWQFRLLRNGGTELLRVATLRDMQRVQWTDPDGKATMGLGFFVTYTGSVKAVSHTGACPGYFSVLAMVPKDELAVIVMTNNQVSISEYSRPIRAILEKGRSLPPRVLTGEVPDLAAFAGIYNRRNRGSEEAFVPWGGGLAALNLPSRDPAGSLTILKHVSGDQFRWVRDDGTLGGELLFLRNAEGKVSGNRSEFQISDRMRDLPN
jgi:CubicO group peptidase (beta-lactamase class C family)